MGAGLQQNEGKEWGPTIWNKMTHSTPSKVFTDAAQRSATKARYYGCSSTTKKVEKYSRKSGSSQARKAYNRHDGARMM